MNVHCIRKCLLTALGTETHAAHVTAATVQLYITADREDNHPLGVMTCLVTCTFLCSRRNESNHKEKQRTITALKPHLFCLENNKQQKHDAERSASFFLACFSSFPFYEVWSKC